LLPEGSESPGLLVRYDEHGETIDLISPIEDELTGQDPQVVPRPLRADVRRSRDRILSVAWSLLTDIQPADLRMEDVVAVGVNRATLYRHYANRVALLDALSRKAGEEVLQAIQARIPSEADAVTKLGHVVAVHFQMTQQVLLSIDLKHAAGQMPPQGHPTGDHPYGHVVRRVRGIVEQGVREGSFHVPHAGFATQTVVRMVEPHVLMWDRAMLGLEDDELHRLLMATLLKALGHCPS
jgi:AcrR family transcriptional regulator